MRGIIQILSLILSLSGLVTIIWTIIIGFSKGAISGLVTLFLPILSSLYWMVKMFGENNAYSYTVLIQLVLTVVIFFFEGRKR